MVAVNGNDFLTSEQEEEQKNSNYTQVVDRIISHNGVDSPKFPALGALRRYLR